MNISFPALLFFSGLAAYLVGSIPFSVIAGKITKGVDIRNEGSGNAGATNAFRVLGWKTAIPVLLADMAKGYLPVSFARRLPVENSELLMLLQITVLAAVVLGHAFPIWAGFRGGKAVAASAAGIAALYPLAAPLPLAIFLITLAISRIVSLSSLAAAAALIPGYFLALKINGEKPSTWLLVFFGVIVLGVMVLHLKNIARLFRGEEPRLGSDKPRKPLNGSKKEGKTT